MRSTPILNLSCSGAEQKFSDFALHPQVVEALEKKGFYNCTPIQALALPLTLAGRDV
ncbi:hypothetical protein MJI37_34420, partial [Salmonella enterica subsp. enterica serovar Cerro]|nr:hypothetical protein [Salmonella enterica subsp. enterica serovar Cerro]